MKYDYFFYKGVGTAFFKGDLYGMDLLVGDLVSFLAAAGLELEEHCLW